MKRVVVMGAGSWGTALAILLNKNGNKVTLWCFSEEEKKVIEKTRENLSFLPGVLIPNDIEITSDFVEALFNKDIVVIAIPSKFVRDNMENFAPYINSKQIIVNASKGLENDTLLTMSQVISEVVPHCLVSTLSGPSHAEEVAKDIPTACVISSKSKKVAEIVQDTFMTPKFRVYTNPDLIGVELGGALKNVIALAAGIVDGLGFGDNTKAALMTRGMVEITRLGVAMGADFQTFNGLSGIGDLIVTCTSMHSRNRRAGILIGQGKSLEEALKEVKMVVEGVNSATAAYKLSKKYNVEMPIIQEIYKVLFEGKSPKEAVVDLMMRDKKIEHQKEEIHWNHYVSWEKE
ncbi:NAD(P)H-dependent glycerol-3-phosphate dehydrogenase [Defluviitalea phaphyphila]|uniref:NAD(P)H-dependent glycerol-3-phosphate dehydrogenase n=1 Tax=Defluviitalea phaphyphila TaxID=1473580 RepID=UPI00073065A9|nr:NAD(P)H-dependent glycerol-3-phosphate dehydrogenase [Defluviitalea phaphyphila]